jgi:hypothetical protein
MLSVDHHPLVDGPDRYGLMRTMETITPAPVPGPARNQP